MKTYFNKAREYFESNEYLWNSGMFLWNVNNIISLIREHLPKTYNALSFLLDIEDNKIYSEINKNYKNTNAISIDYGILEKAKTYI